MKLELPIQIYEKYSDINFMKLRPLGAELHADGQTDMTKLIVAFRNFAKALEEYFVDNWFPIIAVNCYHHTLYFLLIS